MVTGDNDSKQKMICENFGKYEGCEKYIKGRIKYKNKKRLCRRCYNHLVLKDKQKREKEK